MDAHDEARHAAGSPGGTLLEWLAERIGGRARADAVFGPPVEHGPVTAIPVARVRWGIGGGGGEDRQGAGASGSGGGGGVAADPVGYIEITGAGATFRPIGHAFANPGFILASALALGIVLRAVRKMRS